MTLTVRDALLLVLDQVDYTRQNCGVTEMVGAVLPTGVIQKAREALEDDERNNPPPLSLGRRPRSLIDRP